MTSRWKVEGLLFAACVLGMAVTRAIPFPETRGWIVRIVFLVLGGLAVPLLVDAVRCWRIHRTEQAELAAWNALRQAYGEAFLRGDVEEVARLRRAIDERSEAPTTRSARARRNVGLGEELLLREQWSEARDVLASIDRSLLPVAVRPGVLNNLAFATALAGDPEKGCRLAEEALAEAGEDPTYPEEKLATLRGTHGVALSLAGRHEEAVPRLELSLDQPGPRSIATNAFHLGVSLWALGRREEARHAWEIGARQTGRFAERSRDELLVRGEVA